MVKSKTIAMVMMLLMTFAFIIVPISYAHNPAWEIISRPYLVASPSPVGAGQTVAVVMWIDEPLPSATVDNDIRRHDYTLTITGPDNFVKTEHWDVVLDTTSIQYYEFTPDKAGNYTLKFDYGGQTYTWAGAFQNDTILPASKTTTLVVQEEPIPSSPSFYPLPTEYWTRPIEGENWNWYTVSSNWLGAPYIAEGGESYPQNGFHQPVGTAPNTAHIMWTKPIQWGGVVGGNDTAVLGEAFYTGNSYNVRFSNPLIMYGTLYYQEPYGNSGGGGDYVAVDLRTGQELWRINPAATGVNLVPKFGYLYSWETPNQHGVVPDGALIAAARVSGQGTVWRGYDPRTGVLTSMNITNVPQYGAAVAGPQGEYLQYFLTNIGTSSNPNWRLMLWNSSRVFGGGTARSSPSNWYSGTADASLPSAYDWNVSVTLSAGSWTIMYQFWQYNQMVDYGNVMLVGKDFINGHPFDAYGVGYAAEPTIMAAISLKPNSLGQVLWQKEIPQVEGNSRYVTTWDPNAGIFIIRDRHLLDIYAYSIATGEKVWGPVHLEDSDFATDLGFLDSSAETCAYGKVFVAGYSGLVKAFDEKTGDLLWTYGNGGEGNSTFVGGVGPFGRDPIFVNLVADGKIYLSSVQHSPNSPLYMNYKFRALNATDGTELWTLYQYGNLMYSSTVVLADGYLSFLNNYDSQIYTIGKGPSATTVTAPDIAAPFNTPVVIKGTVLDIAAGTKQAEQAARFPNGVPAVSDESMSAWMEYVYQQKPRPTDTVGVDVTLSVVDSNNNYREIGTVKSDSDGFFSYQWTPDIPGKYTVIATFSGSESYWPSHAETAFTVMQEPEATPAPTATPASMTEIYFLPSVAGIIIAIAVVGAVLALMLRRRP